jgi:prolyl oligopeptidase
MLRCAASETRMLEISPAPVAPRGDVVDLLHGVAVPDPFRPLEDEAAPEMAAWVAAQQARTQAVLDAIPGRAALVERLREL